MLEFNNPSEILAAYENGFQGWIFNQETQDDLFHDKKLQFGAADDPLPDGRGKRVLLWRYRDKFQPGACGQEPQGTGDCTSHGVRNAIDITKACDIILHNEPESYYKPTATEPHYGARGHGGEGADPALLTRFLVDYGFLARENYPGVVDLSKYNWKIGHNWGRRGVPQEVKELCKQHAANAWVQPRTPEEMMGLQLSGRGGHSGQQLGFRRTPNADGTFEPITRGSGAWNHDMAHGGYDDTRDFFKERVYFFINSWAMWCDPPKNWPVDLYGPYPTGLIVCRGDVFEQFALGTRSIFYFKGVDGYPAKTFADLGTSWM